ncbi:MAG TPA: ROK family protein [Steroidobacteraceae bacterium]|jgi:polyphosphate glucokinase
MKKAIRKTPKRPRRILVIDVGGTHVKLRVGTDGEPLRFDSGPKMGPLQMVRRICKLTSEWRYDAVSIGYPGLVFHGRITAEPHNLGKGWVRYDFAKRFGVPVRVINDAAMQAIGSYEGGRMLFLGLGTGLGATLILNGVVEPMEIGHMPYRHGRTFEHYVGQRGLEKYGLKKWRKLVTEVVDQLRTVLEVDYVVLGGGNTRRVKQPPKKTRRGDNLNAFTGGLKLWHETDSDALILRGYR